jgi:hypothetical protein
LPNSPPPPLRLRASDSLQHLSQQTAPRTFAGSHAVLRTSGREPCPPAPPRGRAHPPAPRAVAAGCAGLHLCSSACPTRAACASACHRAPHAGTRATPPHAAPSHTVAHAPPPRNTYRLRQGWPSRIAQFDITLALYTILIFEKLLVAGIRPSPNSSSLSSSSFTCEPLYISLFTATQKHTHKKKLQPSFSTSELFLASHPL